MFATIFNVINQKIYFIYILSNHIFVSWCKAFILVHEQAGEVIGDLQTDYPKDLYYTKQTIDNACGTVALVHALANNQDQINFDGLYILIFVAVDLLQE